MTAHIQRISSRLNGEINDAALIENDIIQIDRPIRPGSAGTGFPIHAILNSSSTFPVRISASVIVESRRDGAQGRRSFDRVVRSVKNLAALFVASALLAGLFLQVAASLQAVMASQSSR